MRYQAIYDEYRLLLSDQSENLKILSTLSDGYISKKRISGKHYFYLQKKVDGKMISEYIREELLPQVESELQKRAVLADALAQTDKKLNNLEAATKMLDTSLYRQLIVLRRCSLMDSLPVEERKKSLAFGNAMTALEGIPASENTEKSLALWVSGQQSFKDGYLQALRSHNLVEAW